MALKILLVKDNQVICELPLSMEDWPKEQLITELASSEQDFNNFSKLFDALSHETRLKMMKLLLQDEDFALGFADFMRDLDLNPKIVWESTRKLRESGLLEKCEDGKYRCSNFGQASFIMLNLALRRLLQTLRELEEL